MADGAVLLKDLRAESHIAVTGPVHCLSAGHQVGNPLVGGRETSSQFGNSLLDSGKLRLVQAEQHLALLNELRRSLSLADGGK